MKTLMIGLDGAQAETFKRGWTPFLASLIDNGTALCLKEDLISRGWAEILTGQHATTTGALYERPVLDGTYQWTEKFNVNDSPGLGTGVKPLWQVLNERGYRVGIMNVPTTNPAPEVDGFFVSGGGGGRGTAQDVTHEQCHPVDVKKILDDMGYILDERLSSLLGEKKLYDPEDLFARLEEMSQVRTKAFIDLSHRYSIDFGFVVYKSSIVETEFLALTELERCQNGCQNINEKFLNALENFYRAFDSQVKKLVEEFPNCEVILVSDHGSVKRRWSVNPNSFLVERDYQRVSSGRSTLFDFIRSKRFWIPRVLRKKLKSSQPIKTAYASMVTFEPGESLAFSITRTNIIHGIYINDRRRFGGPVEESDIEEVKGNIIRDFNESPEAITHGMSARALPVSGDSCSKYFPDIILDMPDAYTSSNDQQTFLKEYGHCENPIDLRKLGRGEKLVVKGHYPLAVVSNGHWMVEPTNDRIDLRNIYDQILATFTNTTSA